MKTLTLSTLAALTLSTAAFAETMTLYTDPTTGQVYTQSGEGREEMGDFVSAKEVYLQNQEQDSVVAKKASKKKNVPVFAHASKLKFSGLTYIGYTYNNVDDGQTSTGGNFKDDTSQFEIRRAYLQLKAYLLDDPKSYYRVTLDVHQDSKQTGSGTDGDNLLRLKYAYLYVNAIAPYTGMEFGIAHRPWHDYEEHNSWYYRDISKVLIEQGNGAHLSNSADFGVMFKTKTQYFDADYGIYNGEGYHDLQANLGVSFEWRTTVHLLGVAGKDKQTKKTYWDASFFGQYNMDHIETAANNTDDLIFGGLHTVYNQPEFLVSAQYVQSQDTADNSSYTTKGSGSGYSVNGEYRLGDEKEYRILGRYDAWTPTEVSSVSEFQQNTYIAGVAWQENDNVQWVANVDITDDAKGSDREKYNGTAFMLTAQVEF